MDKRQVDITDPEQARPCLNEPMVEDDCTISFYCDCWFDVDGYFGLKTAELDYVWVDFYIFYNPQTKKITAKYCVKYPDSEDWFDWHLNRKEKKMFRALMDKCIKHECRNEGYASLDDFIQNIDDEAA